MIELRKAITTDIFDYVSLKGALHDYCSVRDKITLLLRQGIIVRVKKGLYTFGLDWARAPISREVLANLIYGPSYISLDYALGYYGMIPERVEEVGSVCIGKRKFGSKPIEQVIALLLA